MQFNTPITNTKLPPTAPRAHKPSSVQPQGMTRETDPKNTDRMVQEEVAQAATAEKVNIAGSERDTYDEKLYHSQ